MGAWAWGLLLLPLLASAQIQAVTPVPTVCSVDKTVLSVEENTQPQGPLVKVSLPDGQQLALGAQSTPGAFRVEGGELYLNMTPDYEETTVLRAELECRSGDSVVTQLRVFVTVLDVNDNAPTFSSTIFVKKVPEDTKVDTIVIPASTLRAQDLDKDDILFYTLQSVTPDADFFSLAGVNQPDLMLIQPLQFQEWTNITLKLLVQDASPNHTAAATLALEVQPADLRPPWFLPCAYTDSHVCIQARYRGAVLTGQAMVAPLALSPGPIYAVDGDWGIGEGIEYSIMGGNQEAFFSIGTDSGNLTLRATVPSPQTFELLVKAEQVDRARYSVTQVTVEAKDPGGGAPSFPLKLYRGFLVLGHGEGVAVKDTADPSQPLTIRAHDREFPDYNGAFTYHITNDSHFRMEGEAVLTTGLLATPGVYFLEVQAANTQTSRSASAAIEVQVSSEPTPEPGGSLAEAPRFSTVQMAALGGVLGALLLLALLALAVLVHKHYGHRLQCCPCCSHKAPEALPDGQDDQAFESDGEDNWAPVPSPPPAAPSPGHTALEPRAPPQPPESPSPGPGPKSPACAEGSPTAMRSILTKERRPESGYKAVWFGDDIGAEADVVVLNVPAADTGRSDSEDGDGWDSGDDEDSKNIENGDGRGGESTFLGPQEDVPH
ncbi:cadherin-related family member 5 [Erinaceus europaeus]|uniref:Cadherin-related family member 5 n=1 Tax=Erinaceus europaeus TaxID=9365 RepID=A0ABM3W5Q5_ERIEU|nr:cadherin-related family member 5 [Erinaceus europaeus]